MIVIAGTAHPSTIAQVDALAGAGWPVIRLRCLPDDAPWEHEDYRQALTDALRPGVTGVAVSTLSGLSVSERSVVLADKSVNSEQVISALRTLAGALPGVLGLGQRVGLIITGGETALHVCRTLGATAIEITGEALPGIPLGLLDLPSGPIRIATKSGGFGIPDALLRTAEALRQPG